MLKTAGIIIIGDEILNGNVTDTNSPFLCKRFFSLGIRVCKILTIPDSVNVISEEVAKYSKSFDIVVTTGGVGPTHDDVTYEGVAAAFNTNLKVNREMEKFFNWYLKEGDGCGNKLVTIPSNGEVIFVDLDVPLVSNLSVFPVVKTSNVYIFPGIPSFLRNIFVAMEQQYFQNSTVIYFCRTIYLKVDEIRITTILHETVARYKDTVTFGSYPLLDNSENGEIGKIRIESASLAKCLDAENMLLSKLPSNWLVYKKPKLPNFDIIHRLTAFCSEELEICRVLKISFQIIEECFSKYDISDTFVCFNGGKDCTVLLNLVYSFCLSKKIKKPLKLIYFKEPDSFKEVNTFIEDVKNNYDVDLHILPMPMKNSLNDFMKIEPSRRVCFLGLRKTDPTSANLKPMQETDPDWPRLMRIFPILHWSYKHVWDFIRCADIPYCSLYDQGYTSLGSKSNTRVNSALKFANEDKTVCYKPAFLLSEDKEEREGRYLNRSSVNSESKT